MQKTPEHLLKQLEHKTTVLDIADELAGFVSLLGAYAGKVSSLPARQRPELETQPRAWPAL